MFHPRSIRGSLLSWERVLIVLAILGAVELAICFYGAAAQRRERITTSYGAALAQAVPYLLACTVVLRAKAMPPRRSTLWLGLGFALAFRLVALFGTQPYLSTDVYRYVWDGRVQGAGINPYRYMTSDPALAFLRDAQVYPHINRPDARTIYPPGAEMLFFAITRFGDNVMTMRLAMVGLEALALWALAKMLVAAGLPPQRLLLYAWHPLPVWEFAGSGHVDAAMIALLAGMLLARQRGRDAWAGVALAGAALLKLFPVALFPAVYRRWGWRLPTALAATFVLAYVPYLHVGLRTIFDFLLHGYVSEEGIDNGERFFGLALVNRLLGLHVPTAAFQIFVLLALGALALWAVFARERDVLGPTRRAAALATAFTVLLSPGYAWYFAWLVMFLPFVPRLGLFWMTAASFCLYANWLHTTLDDFFVIHCVIYLPAALLSAWELAKWFAQRRRAAVISGP